MNTFHVSQDGVARACRAQSTETCTASASGLKEHYDSKEEAQLAYEKVQEHKTFKPLVKNRSFTIEERAAIQENMLKDAKKNKRSLTGIEIAERQKYVTEMIGKLRQVSPNEDNNFANASYGYYGYSEDRIKLQNEIIDDFMSKAAKAKKDGEIIFSGGLAGAGKSTILSKHVEIDRESYVSLSADDVKEIMAEKGMVPKVTGLTPMEASSLAHEESLDITDKIFEKLTNDKTNIIMDMTINKAWSVTEKTSAIKHRGYDKIKAIFVDVDPDTSAKRAEQRYVTGMNDYVSKGEGSGGRFLPPNIIKAQATPEGSKYRSQNAQNIVELTEQGVFTEKPLVFDNETDSPFNVSYEEFSGNYDSFIKK